MSDEKYTNVIKFVNRHLPALLDINDSFHRPCHIYCTNKFIKKGIPGWSKCQDFCGIKTADLIKDYLGAKETKKYMDDLNMINHLYVPCIWTRGEEGKASCIEEYKQSLIEFFDQNGLPPQNPINSYKRTSIRNADYRYDEQVIYVNLDDKNNWGINPYYTVTATVDVETKKPRMINIASPLLFVADFDDGNLDEIIESLRNLSTKDTWAIVRTSSNKYHAMNLSRRINVDSNEAELLTNLLKSDKNYLKLCRKNRSYLMRFTPKFYQNFSNHLRFSSDEMMKDSIPKFIGLFSNSGEYRFDSILEDIFKNYLKLIDKN
jgi:hypothetical protein